jgi:hypothetical protein
MHLGNFEAGVRTMASYWDELAAVGREGLVVGS